jgi:hypothetical protein
MTLAELRQLIKEAEGKTLQFKGPECVTFTDLDENGYSFFNHKKEEYRIKPSQKLRPWKAKEVPVGALFRYKQEPNEPSSLILGVDNFHIFFISKYGKVESCTFLDMSVSREHSTDNGKTWHSCGVLMEE